MELISVGPVEGGPDELEQQVRAALSGRDDALSVAILYCPIDADAAAYVRAIRAVTKVPIVGATTGGAAFTQRGFARNGVCAGFLLRGNRSIADQQRAFIATN